MKRIHEHEATCSTSQTEVIEVAEDKDDNKNNNLDALERCDPGKLNKSMSTYFVTQVKSLHVIKKLNMTRVCI